MFFLKLAQYLIKNIRIRHQIKQVPYEKGVFICSRFIHCTYWRFYLSYYCRVLAIFLVYIKKYMTEVPICPSILSRAGMSDRNVWQKCQNGILGYCVRLLIGRHPNWILNYNLWAPVTSERHCALATYIPY